MDFVQPLSFCRVSRFAEIREPGGGFDHGSFWQQQRPRRKGKIDLAELRGSKDESQRKSAKTSLLLPQMRLGNSSRSPTIAGLVLEHLCPTIQNILEDGLRDHKLDLIIGQQRNHSWRVVEVSTRIGKCS